MEDQFPGLRNKSIIKTERALLRPLTFEYMPGVFRHKSDPEIIQWKKPDTEISQSRRWVEKRLANPRCWNFVVHWLPEEFKDKEPDDSWLEPSEHDKNQILGLCGVWNAPELGYAFHPSAWGKGLATEAVGALTKEYWETFPNGHPALEREEERNYLSALTDKSNRASKNVLTKNGFQWWKDFEDDIEIDETGKTRKDVFDMWRLWKPGYDGDRNMLD